MSDITFTEALNVLIAATVSPSNSPLPQRTIFFTRTFKSGKLLNILKRMSSICNSAFRYFADCFSIISEILPCKKRGSSNNNTIKIPMMTEKMMRTFFIALNVFNTFYTDFGQRYKIT